MPFSFSPQVVASCFLLAASSTARLGVASAQMSMASHVMGTRDQTPPEKLPVPEKMTGIGNVHMQITATPEAQMWFDQGLNLLHDFWDYESARAFEESVRVDPRCAMCYWGLYKAESFYHSIAKGYAGAALAKAINLKSHVSKRERLYIEATAASEPASGSGKREAARQSALQLWRTLVRKYPKDTQARIFLAGLVDHKESVALLQSILKEEPENSAANHYYIHALEASDHPEQALHSAEILGKLAPASGHMVHMPGHIFFRMGDYARAQESFDRSMQVDEEYMREQHVQPDNDWNYVHNLMYSVANLMEEGKLEEADALSKRLTGARGELESTLYVNSTRDSIARLNPGLPVALRTADWPRVIELAKSTTQVAGDSNLTFLSRQLVCFATGMRAAEARDLQSAEESSTRFDAELWRISQGQKSSDRTVQDKKQPPAAPPKLEVMPDALLQPLLRSLSVMSLELRAAVLAEQGHGSEAKRLFERTAQEEKELGYREPPAYIRPVAETEGAVMMAASNWSDAKAAFKRALAERPRSGFPLYGIAISSEKSGDFKAAAREYADFLSAWKGADRELAQMRHAQAYLAKRDVSRSGS